LTALRVGLPIVAEARAYNDQRFEGTVASIDSRVDPVTRSITVRALIPNEDRILKPGLLMSVELLKNQREAIVLPEEALVPEADRNFVFVTKEVDGKSVTEKREVQI